MSSQPSPQPASDHSANGAAGAPPVEARLVQAGKLSMGQLAQAHRDRLETGKPVLDIIVERGWVTAEEVAELRAAHGIEAPLIAPMQAVPEPLQVAPEPPPETEAPPP